jgi:hypothetical protein
MSVTFAILEWWDWYQRILPNPIPAGVLAFLIFVFALYKDRQLRKKDAKYKLGSHGEKAVGQVLDELKIKGYAVLHDIVVNGRQSFNIDHVVISTHGIYAIETKTVSKPAKEQAKAHFDGEKVILAGRKPDEGAVKQSMANAHWLHDEIQKSTGKSFRVNPVVVYPGWWVDGYIGKDVWVLNPTALEFNINNQPESITQSDTYMIFYHLSRIVTAQGTPDNKLNPA